MLANILIAQVGINTITPTNTLHVRGDTTTDPLRIEGLLTSPGNLESLVATSTGVVKRQSFNTVSAVRVSGNLNIIPNNSFVNINATSAPIKEYDNLSEFSGNMFTASQAGLYLMIFTVTFPQRAASLDSGDGYFVINEINTAGVVTQNRGKIFLPESGLTAQSQYMTVKNIAKLNVGETCSFRTLVYGSTGNVTGVTYKINIVRMD